MNLREILKLRRIRTMQVRVMTQRLRQPRMTPECTCAVCTAQRAGKMASLTEVLQALSGEDATPLESALLRGGRAH